MIMSCKFVEFTQIQTFNFMFINFKMEQYKFFPSKIYDYFLGFICVYHHVDFDSPYCSLNCCDLDMTFYSMLWPVSFHTMTYFYVMYKYVFSEWRSIRPVDINQYDITIATHYDITMSNDIARDL